MSRDLVLEGVRTLRYPLRPATETLLATSAYMAMGCPLVSFDLKEARVSVGDAATYAPANDEAALAAALDHLLRDTDLREAMGTIGRQRVETHLSWDNSRPAHGEFLRPVA